jgi:transcriptional regulator with XRE-family HTH domain
LTQAQLAEAVKAPLRTVQNWEQGRREPDLTTLKKLAKVLNTSLDLLVLEPEPKKGDSACVWLCQSSTPPGRTPADSGAKCIAEK